MTGGWSIFGLAWRVDVTNGRAWRDGPGRLLVATALLLVTGCDPGAFVPPRPAELSGDAVPVAAPSGGGVLTRSGGTAGAVPASVRPIELILPPYEPEEADVLTTKARAIAGMEKSRIQIVVANKEGGDQSQAALVRKAAGKNPMAVIVEIADPADPDLAQAIGEVRDRGLAVILMGRPMAEGKVPPPAAQAKGNESAGAGRIVTVAPEPFPGSARQIVEATVNNARNIGFTPDGGALLSIDTAGDSMAADRTEALRTALKNAGVSPVKELKFHGDLKTAREKAVELIKANPKMGMVLSNDHTGLTGSFHAMNDVGESRHYVVGGYTNDDSSAKMTQGGEFAGAAIYSTERLLYKTISTAVALARGEKVADRVEVMVPVSVSPANAGAPKTFKQMAGPGPSPDAPKPADRPRPNATTKTP